MHKLVSFAWGGGNLLNFQYILLTVSCALWYVYYLTYIVLWYMQYELPTEKHLFTILLQVKQTWV